MDIILKIYEEDLPIYDEVDILTFKLSSINCKYQILIKEIEYISENLWAVIISNNSGYQIKTYLDLEYNSNINISNLNNCTAFEYKMILSEDRDYILIRGLLS